MCTSCVAQGAVYVGGAVTALRVMAHRAALRRSRIPLVDEPPVEVAATPAADERRPRG